MSQPEIDTFYADTAFLEVDGTTATKVKAAIWAFVNLPLRTAEYGMSLNEIRAFLVESGFEVMKR